MSDDISRWLERLQLGNYAKTFQENDIDPRSLIYISDEDLRELGVSLGHRRIMLAAIAGLGRDRASRHEEGTKPGQRSKDVVERRQLSVMFCDLVGATELSRQLDPEDLRELLLQYQDEVTEAVVRYGGYVAKFLGDGVLAYFGWPQAYEDQAERAVRAGLDAIALVNNIQFGQNDRLSARVGIATGQVVVGDLVGKVTSDTEAVVGETPNLASRLQGVAAVNQLVISSSTRLLLGTAFELANLGAHRLKGFSEEVDVWRVVGEGAAETRFEAAHSAPLSQLVGREHELGLLQERWELAKAGEGQVVLLSGEAGIGKSRMLEGFTKGIGTESWSRFYYQCSPHHTKSAFFPIIQRMKRTAGIAEEDDNSTKLDKLEALLLPTGNIDGVIPLLAQLLSIPDEGRFQPIDLSPQQFRYQIIQALVEQIVAVSKRRPVVLLIEDAHWIDPSTAECVGEIIPRIADQNVLIVITYRPEFTPVWSGHQHLSLISLNRLGRKQAAEIAQSVGGKGLMNAIIERIVVRADGVPLYVEELTKSVLEGYTDKDETAVEAAIPASLQSSLEARLDRLGDAKEIAQMGSVIGRDFRFDVLAEVADKSESETLASLDRLVQSGLLFQRGTPPHARYAFKHALVQDAAYNTMLISRRRRLHARILKVLEAEQGEQPGEKIDLLGYHAHQGEVWEKAFAYLHKAGLNAMDRAAVREAAGHFEQALSASAQLPETNESLEQAIDLRFELRNALWSIGAFEEILTHLADAEQLAKRLDDPKRIGWASVFRSASLWQLGRSQEAQNAAKKALKINETPNDLSLNIGANFYLGCAIVTSGACKQAESYFQNVVDATDGKFSRQRCGLPFVPSVVARSWLLWALAERGEFDQSAQHGEVALKIAKEVGHPFNLAHIYYDLGYYYGVKGEFHEAVETLEKAYELIQEWNLTYLSPFISGFLGHVCAQAGRIDEGVSLLEKANSEYQSMGLGLFRSLVGVHLGEALFLANRFEEARDVTEGALSLARQRNEQGHRAYAHRILGKIAAQPESWSAKIAQDQFEQARKLAKSLGMRPLVAHCSLDLGRFYQQAEKSVDALEQVGTAATLYGELGMHHWKEQANSLMKE